MRRISIVNVALIFVSGILKDQTIPCQSCLISPHASTARRRELTGVRGTSEPSMLRLVIGWLVKVDDDEFFGFRDYSYLDVAASRATYAQYRQGY